jgi:hypothetical protein
MMRKLIENFHCAEIIVGENSTENVGACSPQQSLLQADFRVRMVVKGSDPVTLHTVCCFQKALHARRHQQHYLLKVGG